MKGSLVTTFAVGGVLLLLTLFLGLQYNWLKQASDAERERMQRRVETDTKNFADDFNREMQAAYFNFQTDAALWEKPDWTEFNERYDYWKSKTQYPDLIKEFVFFGKGKAEPLRYDPNARGFVKADVPPELISLREQVEADRSFKPFYEEPYAFVAPVHAAETRIEHIVFKSRKEGEPPVVKMPERYGFLVIELDKNVITGRILPDLAAKHFPEGNFRVAVRNKVDATVYETAVLSSEPDAKAGLLSLTPDSLIFFRSSGIRSQAQSEKRQGMVVSERVESKTFTHTETNSDGTRTGRFKIELQPGQTNSSGNVETRTSVIASTGDVSDQWTLNVQHAAGSIGAFADNEFRKNFAIGFGLYLLLVGAIVAIVLSALRSKRFAQRQIDFVSSVSHEFRTPLAVIYSAGENLADGVTDDREQVLRYGNLIKGEGRKLSAMVEQILQFAGAKSGRRKYNFASVRPNELVAAAINECAPIIKENGIEVETAIDENLPNVTADADAIITALQNLISNSVKYGNGSRRVRVAATNGDGVVKIAVKDNGIGIAADDLRHIFEPFYRARNVVDAQIRGNGLGLALVKEIAEAHGGAVRVNSEVGKGSEFTIELPQV